MKLKKIQLAAGAVIANSMLALALPLPRVAQASTCESQIVCDTWCAVIGSPNFSTCVQNAPPGCVAVDAVCLFFNPCGLNGAEVVCYYEPQ